jgi:hypothetical protein
MPVPLFPRNERPDSNVLCWIQVYGGSPDPSWKIGGWDDKTESWFILAVLHEDGQRVVVPNESKTYLFELAVGYWTWFKPLDIPPAIRDGEVIDHVAR